MKSIKIYRLIYNNKVIYIGQTTQTLKQRKIRANTSVPVEIYKLSTIELIEETLDVSRERYWMEFYKGVGIKLMNKQNGNHSIETRKKQKDDCAKAYGQYNKKQKAAYDKDYRQYNKERIAVQDKDYYQKNKEKIAAHDKDYYQKNKEKIAAREKAYYQKNKEKIAARMKAYYQAKKKNKEKKI